MWGGGDWLQGEGQCLCQHLHNTPDRVGARAEVGFDGQCGCLQQHATLVNALQDLDRVDMCIEDVFCCYTCTPVAEFVAAVPR